MCITLDLPVTVLCFQLFQFPTVYPPPPPFAKITRRLQAKCYYFE